MRVEDTWGTTHGCVSLRLASECTFHTVIPAISWRGSIGEVPFPKSNLKMDSGQKPAGMTKKNMGLGVG